MPKAGAPESATLNLREVRKGQAEVLEGAQAIAAGERPAQNSDSRAQSLAEPPGKGRGEQRAQIGEGRKEPREQATGKRA